MRHVLICVFLQVLCSCDEAKKPKRLPIYEDSAITHISFSPPGIYLDSLIKGEKVDTCFYIKNIGGRRFDIISIRPSCSCTNISYQDNKISPGDSLKVSFRFIAAKQKHAYYTSIMVYGNTKPSYRAFNMECYVK